MVGDALKVADGLQQLRGLLALRRAHLLGAELHQIGAQHVLIVVAALLLLPDALRPLRRAVGKGAQRAVQRLHGAGGHLLRHGAALLQRQRRRGQQALIQLRLLLDPLLRLVRHQPDGQLFQQTAAGQQHGRTDDVEAGVCDGDAVHGGALVEDARLEDGLEDAEHRQQHRHADDVEQQVYHGGAPCVLIGAHGGQQRRNAGADILAHDDGDGGGVADLSRDGQCLQDTHGGGAGLDDARQHRAGQHAQHRVLEGDEQLCEGGHVLQARHRAAHGVHTEHQRGEAQQDHAGVLLPAVFAEHIEDNAHQRQHRRKGRGLQQIDPHTAAADARHAQQPRRHGGAHVGAHNDVDGLPQRHQAGVDKAHHHHRGGRRALDHGGDAQTGQKAGHDPSGHPVQHRPQLAAGPPLQRLPHQIHTEQEQAQATDHCQHVKNRHIALSSFLHIRDHPQDNTPLSNPK